MKVAIYCRLSAEDRNKLSEEDDSGSIQNQKVIWNMTQKDIELDIPVLNLPVGDIIMGLMCEIRHMEKGADEK